MNRKPRQTANSRHTPLASEGSNDVSTLWITGPSLELQQKLVRMDGPHPTIIIRLEATCDTDTIPDQTLDLIADVICSRDVQCIVVCGQSADAPVSSRMDQCLPHESISSYDRILRRITARLKRQQRIQERVRTQIRQIRAHAGLALALTSRPIRLCGMLYIPESDAFLVYDDAADQFVAMGIAGVSGGDES